MKKLKVLFASSEVYPFAKTGGLADVSYALPKALNELGHEVRIIMPKYKVINERKFVLREVIRLKEIPITVGGSTRRINVKSAFTPDPNKIQTYFIDFKQFFGREGLYVDEKKKTDYQDNDERFILFAKGIFETLKLLFWQPDIIHCNDWQTGIVPLLLKTAYKNDEFFKKTATLFTIHNVGFQGNFPAESYAKIGLDAPAFEKGGPFEYYDKFSFLKTGLYYADFVNTVSKTYAQEVQDSGEYGFGFEDFFQERKKKFTGILNGIDYNIWNPDTDELIPENYNSQKIKNKEENKKALLERCGLQYDEAVPVIGMVSRLADQKGFDLISEAADALFERDIRFVQLGTGEKKYHTVLKGLQKKHKSKVSVNLKFDDELAHLIEAGSDMFLMPSRYEPCGLNQMFSLKYGTVPVVRRTGGLADTVFEFEPDTGKGNGFVFEEYAADAMLGAIDRAISQFGDTKSWRRIMRNGMRADHSWIASAKKYSKVYEKILKR